MGSQLRIVLVEPAGARNVGAIARVMKNFDLTRLVIVNPQCEVWGEDARRMAVHAPEVLEQAVIVDSLAAALHGCQRAIATTARPRDLNTPLELPEQALPWLIESPDLETALIFGPEDRGLSNTELNTAQRFVQIPSSPVYESLNLAQAVAVCAYVLRQSTLAPAAIAPVAPTPLPPAPDAPLATLDALEGLYHHLEAVLLDIGYLYPHTAASRMEKFRSLFGRMALTDQELAMLRGVLSQMEWAMRPDLPTRSRPESD